MGLGPGIDRLGAILLEAGASAAALTGLVALAMVGCRQPARRRDLARAGLLGGLALIPLAAFGPIGPRLEILPPLRAVLEPLRPAWPRPLGVADAAGRTGPRWPSRRLTPLYLAGTSAGLGWIALGSWAARRLVRGAHPPAGATLALYESLPVAGRRPALRVSGRVRGPALLGLVRPQILIPPGLERPEARDRLRLSLLHELAHAEGGDLGSGLIAGLAQAAWFPVPWVWWIGRQMRLDQEFLADLHASNAYGAAPAYASSLVDQAEPVHRETPTAGATPPPAAKGNGAGSALFLRVLMLVRCPYPVEVRAPRWWRWSLPLAATAATLLASMLTFEAAGAAPRPAPGPQVLRIPRLVLAETPARPDGWAPPHDLLVPLPPRFDLELDVWAQPRDLGRIRVAGQGLAPPSAGAPSASEEARWHRVQIRRDRGDVRIRVDGLPVRPEPDLVPTWLRIQPAPDRLGLYRNLVLAW